MKTLIGGAVTSVLGLIGLSIWYMELLQLLTGIIPIMLLLGGALALYLGFDELKDTWKSSEQDKQEKNDSVTDSNEKYKNELKRLKGEIEDLKSKKS